MSSVRGGFLPWIERMIDRVFGSKFKRRAIHRWFLFRRGMTLGVRAAVLDADNRVFLVRHSYVEGWHLPGGGVEQGQSARAALAVELAEEGNILLTGEPEMFSIYHNARAAPRDHVVLFVVRAFRSEGPKIPDSEILEAGFFDQGQLPDGVTASTRQRLKEISGKADIDPVW